MAYNPQNPNGQATSANSSPVVIASDQSAVSMIHAGELFVTSAGNSSTVQLAASAVFTGTIETVLNVPQAQIMVTSDQPLSIQLLQYIDGAGAHLVDSDTFTITGGSTFNKTFTLPGNYFQVKVTNTGASTTTTFDLQTTYGDLPVAPPTTGQFPKAKSISVALASDQGTLPVQDSAAETSLATIAGAVSGTKIQDNIAQVGGSAITLGQAASSASLPVVISSDAGDQIITGQAAQTATVNNIIPATAGTAATTVTGYKSATIQINSTATGGTYIIEGCNDNTNFLQIPVQTISNSSGVQTAGAVVSGSLTPSATNTLYTFPINFAYIRVRISATITGGSIQAITRLSNIPWSSLIQTTAQPTAGNFNVTVGAGTLPTVTTVGTVTTVATMTNGNLGFPATITDVSSGAISTAGLTSSATFTPTFGTAYQVAVPVTTGSGTTPTIDIFVQESMDGGTNWTTVYQFPRISSISAALYTSPPLTARGNRVRYQYYVAGTTPSFTLSVQRTQLSSQGKYIRQIFNRSTDTVSIVLTTLNSTSAVLASESTGTTAAMDVSTSGTWSTSPVVQLQGSDDNLNWYNVGTALTITTGTPTQSTGNITGQSWQFYRATVTTAGVGGTLNYVKLKSF